MASHRKLLSLSVIGGSTPSNMSTREGVVYRREDPHSASSPLQSIPKPLGLRDSATLREPRCNRSLPPLPPSFMERQMDGAGKSGERRACWVASSQTVYNPHNSHDSEGCRGYYQSAAQVERSTRLHGKRLEIIMFYIFVRNYNTWQAYHYRKTIKWTSS